MDIFWNISNRSGIVLSRIILRVKLLLITLNEKIDGIYNLRTSSRFASIDGLRGWAIIMVFNVHFFAGIDWKPFFVNRIVVRLISVFYSGIIGVDLFFVISGFLIFRSLRKNNPVFTEFIKNRINRLLPAHLLILLWLSFSSFRLKSFLVNLAFLPVFIKGYGNINFVTWSLGWEWLFYLIIFLIFMLGRQQQYRRFMAIIGMVALSALLLQWLVASRLESFGVVMPDGGRFLGFFVGVSIAFIESDMKLIVLRLEKYIKAGSVLALVSIPLMQLLWTYKAETIQQTTLFRNSYYLSTSFLFGLILLCAVSFTGGAVKTIFGFKPIRIFGQISHSFYLMHALIGIPLALSLVPPVDSALKMAYYYFVSIVVTFLLASFVYYYLERPYFLRKT